MSSVEIEDLENKDCAVLRIYFNPEVSSKDILDLQLVPKCATAAGGSFTEPSIPYELVGVDALHLPTLDISIEELHNEMVEHLFLNDLEANSIVQVEIHCNVLTCTQFTKAIFYHAFVVLKTINKKWWSIERNVFIFYCYLLAL